jgi:glycosyltransferase involved in cell wall biosynthesis
MRRLPKGESVRGRSGRYRIGIDARTFFYKDSVTRGIGHYAGNHIAHVARLRPHCDFVLWSEFPEGSEAVERLLALPNVRLELLDRFRPDLIDLMHIPDPMNLSPGFDSPMRVFPSCPTTVTFYDLTPLRIYWESWSYPFKDAYLLRLCQLKNGPSRILAISEFTRQDLIDAIKFPAERIHTVMAGFHPPERSGEIDTEARDRVREKYGITKPFFLHVGALDRHKNFTTALESLALMRHLPDVQLVVAGKLDGRMKTLSEQIGKLDAGTLIVPGFVPRADLEVLYQEAIALLFLSTYEGFGLPVLEAMAGSCPVITSTATSLPEVAAGAAILCDPFDIGAISRAMDELIENPDRGEALREAGRRRAREFTWEKTAAATVDIWERMMAALEVEAEALAVEG